MDSEDSSSTLLEGFKKVHTVHSGGYLESLTWVMGILH
jgi:hypothetical protein